MPRRVRFMTWRTRKARKRRGSEKESRRAKRRVRGYKVGKREVHR